MKTTALKWVTVLTLFFSTSQLIAQTDSNQTGDMMDLQDCIDYAFANTGTIKNAVIEQGISQAKVGEIISMGLPQIDIEGQFIDNLKIQQAYLPNIFGDNPNPNEVVPVAFGTQFNGNIQAAASQLIFDGTFFIGVKAAKVYNELSAKELIRSKIDVVEAVTQAYYYVLVQEEYLELINRNKEILEDLYNETKATYEAGMVEEIEFNRIEVTYNSILIQQTQLEQLQIIAKKLLKFQMGMDINAPLQLAQSLEDFRDFIVTPTDLAEASRRIEYSIMMTNIKLNNFDIRATKAEYWPKLYAFGAYGFNAGGNVISDFNSNYGDFANIGLNLTFKVFDGFNRSKRIEQKKLKGQQLQNTKTDLERQISIEQEQSRITYETNLSTLNLQEKNMNVADKVYTNTQVKFKNGVGSSLEITTSAQDYQTAANSFYTSLYDVLVAKLAFEKANGRLLNYIESEDKSKDEETLQKHNKGK
ncbi:TolC family protein [Flammeovirga yaeyamensis]|uniref:TolC family protein n=1 Tax=Flammeovirga yaeyamensis TaxID=367791 RepID=A0AAX1N916_9BACT|nr:TolC family protein [Flammeovirga yaeyamensis]MBB3700350.1 outer membrane protein TolC [Flammeovirga yaeyamensis]NMF37024.1 TolC family protein [Flammeovirga yaeyamensis]QWG02433.1 TolC family protein [Flammeovirga yaeyamensis]